MGEEPNKVKKPENQPKEAEKPEKAEKPEPEVDELTTAKLNAIKKILALGEKEGKGLEIVDFKAEKKEEKKKDDSPKKTEGDKKFINKYKSIFITIGVTLTIILIITFGAKNSGIIGGSVIDISDEPITKPIPHNSEESTDVDEKPVKKELDEPEEEHEEQVDEHDEEQVNEHDVIDEHNASEQSIEDNVQYSTVLNYLGQRLFGYEAEDDVEEDVEEDKLEEAEDEGVTEGVIGYLRGKLLSVLNMNASES